MSRKENNVENAQKNKSGFKIFLRILLALLIIIVIFVLSALGGSWWFLNSKLDKVQYVNIPVGYQHCINNVGDDELILILWANELFDPSRPDTFVMEA